MLLCFLGYITLTFLISISLQRDTRLSNWDMTYPFILGNELTGDRPWKGRIYELYIVNRAISEEEVEQAFSEKGSFNSIGDSILVSYQFKDNENHLDKMGSLPNLIWMGDSQVVQYDEGILLGPNHWLKTETSAEDLTRRIIETSQFTLSVKVATSDTMQTGPARIVSLSKDLYNRNFTLGQEGSDLVFRLRTPLTGVDGSNPELIVPYIFSNTDPHNLLITYDGSVLNLYVDGVRHYPALELTPGAATPLKYIFPIGCGLDMNKYLYYAFIFIPLGILFIFMAKKMRKRLLVQISLIFGCTLLPSFILEGFLVTVSGRVVRFENILFSVMFMVAPMVLFKLYRTQIVTDIRR